jgi:hypothetical protein
MSLFQNIFGGQDASGINQLLSPEQRAAIERQSMLSLGARLLQSSRTPERVNLAQALGGALEAGMQAQQAGQASAVQQILMGQKIQEARDAATRRQRLAGLFTPSAATPATPATPLTAEQALLASPAVGGQVGPTTQRAAMIGTMPTPAPTQAGMPAGAPAATDLRSFISSLPEADRQALAMMPEEQAMKAVNERLTAASTFGAPVNMNIDGKNVVAQQNSLGGLRVISGAQPYEVSPDVVRILRATGTPVTLENVERVKRSGASSQVVKLPPGPSQFVQGLGTAAAGNLDAGLAAASAANATLRNIDLIAPALDQAVLGPGADYRTAMLRVGSVLGVTGENTDQVLQNTRQVVQGLARAEMDAAQGMKGQGQITDSERAIIRRMSLGEQNMTAAELRTGMAAMQKLANERLQSYQGTLDRARKIPGFESVAPMFEVTPYRSQFNLGTNLNLGNAVREELNRRQGGR